MKTYSIATIPGDGIGKEVVPAGDEVLEALAKRDGALRASSSSTSTGAATTTASTA